jgi:hypothetical protein
MGLFSQIREGFEHVDLKDEDGSQQRLTRIEFEQLPLNKRVWAILNKRLRFYRGDIEITMKEALNR